MTQINNMKKLIVLSVFIVSLAFGTSAMAENCNVVKGDSLWKIAKRYNIRFSDLCEANRHLRNQSLIFPYERVKLPHGSEGESTNQNSNVDVIQEGKEQLMDSETTNQATEVLNLVNKERKKNGLKELILDNQLTSVANIKAKDMADKGYFSHNSATYGSPFEMLQRFGIEYSTAGENIAGGQSTPQEVMTDWLNSSGHRANILNSNYSKLGVGFYEGGQLHTYWVQMFTN